MFSYYNYFPGAVDVKKRVMPMSISTDGNLYEIKRTLNITEIVVDLETNTVTGICTRKQIVRGNLVSSLEHETKYAPCKWVKILYEV